MSGEVKPRRTYPSTIRGKARRTRRAIIDAARHLFLTDGFAATTMPAVAAAAGVAVQTVYKAFANKPRLAKAVFDAAIAGDDDTMPMLERKPCARCATNPTRPRCSTCTATSTRPSPPATSPSNSSSVTPHRHPDARAVWPNSKPNASPG